MTVHYVFVSGGTAPCHSDNRYFLSGYVQAVGFSHNMSTTDICLLEDLPSLLCTASRSQRFHAFKAK